MAKTSSPRTSPSVIGHAVTIRGRVTGAGDLTLEGALEGDITVDGAFTVADGGKASSEVSAHDVTVSGQLDGNVQATGTVKVTGSGKLRGNVHSAQFSLDEGAFFVGRLEQDVTLPPELSGGERKRR